MPSEIKPNADIFHPTDSETICDPVDLTVFAGYESLQIDGETDLVVQLIDLYFDEVPRQIRAMKAAVAIKNWRGLSSAAHSLRGSSGNVGAQQVAQICAELESPEPIETWSNIPHLLVWLELECERALHIFMEERRSRVG